MVLFDPSTIGVGDLERSNDLPGGSSRAMRKPCGIKGVWVNGIQVFDGENYFEYDKGPGQVLRDFSA